MMRAVLISPGAIAAIAALRDHAESHVVSLAKILRSTSGKEPPIGTDPKHRLELPGGLRMVFSIEDQPSGKFRHASFSVFPGAPGALPHPTLVESVLPLLGFKRSLRQCRTWVEHDAAVNVLEPMEGS